MTDPAYFGRGNHQKWDLKGQSECKGCAGYKCNIAADFRQGNKLLVCKTHKKIKDFRQDNEKGKAGSGSEKQGGPEYYRENSFFLVGMKPGCYEHPDFIDQDRDTENYANNKGKFEVSDKGFSKIRIDEFKRSRLSCKEGRHEEAGNMLSKKIG